MNQLAYVPLRIFSCFTMLEGASRPGAIGPRARELGFPAAALTDRNGLYAAMAFSKGCVGAGVQPIIGALLGVARPAPDGTPLTVDWLPLYAQDETGYRNLCALVSAAHLDRPIEEEAHVSLDALEGRTEGLIALTGGGEGALARLLAEEQAGAASAYADRLAALFPDRLYVEISRRGDPIEEAAESALIDLAYDRGLPLVATNPSCFDTPDFHTAHEAMLCIADSTQLDRDDRRRGSPEAWLKPGAEIAARFTDLPEALANTLVIAQRCAVAAPRRDPILPSIAGDAASECEQLRVDARAGLEDRLRKIAEQQGLPLTSPSVRPELVEGLSFSSTSFGGEEQCFDKLSTNGREDWASEYRERLELELDVITETGFSGYFLIVADFIKWAKEKGIPVGPGRGSGAGSVVSWSLTITDLDPIRLGLLFERFLNLERVTMPDFDIDFCEARRGEVIRYVQEKYGRDQVAQIITFGTMKARAALHDVGRVLQMPYGQCARLAKMVPAHPTEPWTLERALAEVPEFAAEYRDDADVRRLVDLARKIEGLPRHASTHAAGVVIGDRRLDALVPLYRDARSDMPATQFDMKDCEAAGLVKFDFLGLKTLSVLRKAVELLAARGIEVDLDALAWDDEQVYALLQRGDTVGVFQLESEGMRRTLAAVKPTCFEDIIALVSLYRPGPMENIPLFGARKNAASAIEYPHPALEPVLRETYGVFVYQEQVMEAAKVLAGYSLGEADLLRRAMGKKIKSEMDAQRERFVSGAVERSTQRMHADALFDLIAKFAGYGFNKSHAAAYALIAYQTAWLKAHYREEFYAASMCFDLGQTDRLGMFVEDMRRAGVICLPPCVNASTADFTVEEQGEGYAVRYALAALKGVGHRAMELLVAERHANGPFASLDDFSARVDPRLLNTRQLQSLAGAGAFDALSPERAGVFAAVETILAVASRAADNRESGQGGLFGEGEARAAPIRLPRAAQWSPADRLAQEKEAFGFYFSGHPIDRFDELAKGLGARTHGDLLALASPGAGKRREATIAVLVEGVRWRTSRRGGRFAQATVSDASGQFVVSAFDDTPAADLEAAERAGACALLSVELDWPAGEETPRITVRRVQPCDGLAASRPMTLTVAASDPAAAPAIASLLAESRGGRGTLLFEAPLPEGGAARLVLARDLKLDAELAERVKSLDSVADAQLSTERTELALVH